MNKLKLLLSLLIIPFWAHSEGKDFSGRGTFLVISSVTDENLPDQQAKCLFNFKTEGTIYTKEIKIGANKTEFKESPNENGQLTKELKSGKYIFYFLIDGYFEVISDTIELQSKESIIADINFMSTAGPIYVFKPVIYLYPETKIEVSVQLNVNGNLGFTYPAYNNGWNITASPDGNITTNGKEYNYLFWESEMPPYALDGNNQSGFLVATDTLLNFIETSLEKMGFNSKESADFITFWYPKMMVNEKNHIQFLFNESCDAYAELKISPQPDHIFRLGMVWKKATNDFTPEKQILPSMDRTGFTVLEWGGMTDEKLFTKEK